MHAHLQTPSAATLALPQVGHTPLLHIRSLSRPGVRIMAKAEWLQPGGSIKARAARAIIADAITSGRLREGVHLLDASSGNTAIAYATLLRPLGWRPVICLPANASRARKTILRELGAELILTSPLEGTDGAQAEARAMAEHEPEKFFHADQYSNPANWQAHYSTTAAEILTQTRGLITHFVAGLGTTGTFTGTGLAFREAGGIWLTALQPAHPLHPMEGWKHLATAHVPAIYSDQVAHEILPVDPEAVFDMIRFIAAHEDLELSPSAAANLIGAKMVADRLREGLVVTTLADSLERYEEVRHEIFTT